MAGTDGKIRIAIPCAQGRLTTHFGDAREFALVDVTDGQVGEAQVVTPPAHAPGVLPRWLGEQGVDVVIAGGLGRRAQDLLASGGVEVVVGAPSLPPEEVARQYVAGTLEKGVNVCDH